MKKPNLTQSKLKEAVETEKERSVKANLTLTVDAHLLSEARKVFGRKMGVIFEAALEDALRIYKEDKKNR